VFDLLKTRVVSHYRDADRRRTSQWICESVPEGAIGVDFADTVRTPCALAVLIYLLGFSVQSPIFF
jgi:hypothetical protein